MYSAGSLLVLALLLADPSANDLASSISLPSGPGSAQGLFDRPEVNAFTGQASYALPLDLPHGPAGFTPSVKVSYSSGSGNGSLGLGWGLEVVGIRRSLDHGVPTYTSADEIYTVGVAAGRLVPTGAGDYRVEGQGNRLRVQPQGESMVLTDSEGTQYGCGLSASGRMAGSGGVAEWFVEQATNVAGQVAYFSYLQDTNATYLSSVRWGANQEFSATFAYVSRSDSLVNWRRGFAVETRQLLDHIDVTVSGNLLRRYVFTYDFSLPISRLKGVQVLGRDGQTALPPLSFTYYPLAASQTFSMGTTGSWSLANSSAAIMDLDGDGFADLVDMTEGAQRYYHNTGTGFSGPLSLTVPDADSSAVRFIDTQGDGVGRLAVVQNGNWNLYQFNGTATAPLEVPMPGTAGQPLSAAMESGAATCDINADGRTDLLRRLDANTISVRFSDGNSLGAPVTATGLPEDSAGETRFVEFNGDGVTDALILHPDSMDVYIGHGDGSFELAPQSPVFYPLGTVSTTASLLVGDLDRDGLADLVCLAGGDVYWYQGNTAGVRTALKVIH